LVDGIWEEAVGVIGEKLAISIDSVSKSMVEECSGKITNREEVVLYALVIQVYNNIYIPVLVG